MKPTSTHKILAISGSLRAASLNTTLLYAIAGIAPVHFHFEWCNELAGIAPFMPGTPNEAAPGPVQALRRQLLKADAILISTPEYAAGVPGVLKNALDWIVSSGELTDKPIAVITASPGMGGGQLAMQALLPTLRIMGGQVPDSLTLQAPLIGTKMDAQGKITDTTFRIQVLQLLQTLSEVIEKQQTMPQQTGELS
jgi:NAD(P)H-dependent FMN reductase